MLLVLGSLGELDLCPVLVSIIPRKAKNGYIRCVPRSCPATDHVRWESMIMFAIGGKAAESISNGKSETAVYKFISKTDKIDFQINFQNRHRIC